MHVDIVLTSWSFRFMCQGSKEILPPSVCVCVCVCVRVSAYVNNCVFTSRESTCYDIVHGDVIENRDCPHHIISSFSHYKPN